MNIEDLEKQFKATQKKVEKLKAETKKTKDAVELIIFDKKLPLDQRWEFWLKVPEDAKNNKGWIEHFRWEQQLPGRRVSWYDEFYIDRHQTVIMEEIVDRVEENIAYAAQNPDDVSIRETWTQEMLDDFKEEILEKNLYSFVMDW